MVFLKPLDPTIDRERLRAEVYSARAVPTTISGSLVMAPRCAYCDTPLVEAVGFHMHECIITRGDLPRDLQDAIWHPCNVVLLCPECHFRFGHSRRRDSQEDPPERRFIKTLIDEYGRDNIEAWLQSLPLRNAKSLSAWGL